MDFLSKLDTDFLLNSLSEPFIIIDHKGIIQFNNSACEKTFLYSSDELTGQSVNLLMQDADASHHDNYVKKSKDNMHSKVIGSTKDRPLTCKRKDQSVFPADIKITSFEQHGHSYFIGTIRDLSESIYTNNRLTQVLTSTDTILYSLELQEHCLKVAWVSPNITELLGYTIEEASADEWWGKHIHPDDKDHAFKNFDHFFQEGVLEHEYRFLTKDGRYIWIQDKLKLSQESQKHIINGSWNDISEKKRLLSSLIKNEERLAKSQTFANIGTWDWNIQTGELYWSDRIAPLFGYCEGELETTYDNFLDALHPDDKANVIDAITQCIEHNAEYDIEHRVVWPDGQIRWVHEKGDVVKDDKGLPLHMLGVIIDIHDEKILRIQQNRNQQLLNTLHESLTNYTIHSDYKKAADLLLEGLLSTTESEYGFIGEILYREDGTPYLKTSSITNISWNTETQKLYDQSEENGFEFTNLNTLFGHVIKTGGIVVSNSPATDPRSGGLPEGHPEMSSFLGMPVFYGDNLIGMYGLANRANGYDEDIIELLKIFSSTYATIIQARHSLLLQEQNQLDLIQAKEQAVSSNKAKSVFLSSMSHELRTPLNAILGFAQLLRVQGEFNDEARENITDIIQAGNHLTRLINEVLDLAKIESGKTEIFLETVSLAELISECETLLTGLSERHQVTVNFDESCSKNHFVIADYTKLKQITINLISNAIKYNHKNGNVTISCLPQKNNKLLISVQDNGPGIKSKDIPKLFIPFNRLGAEAESGIEGTGIGLLITKNLIELMQGQLFVESKPGKGSIFSFTLSISKQAELEKTEPPSAPEKHNSQKNKKIFYIEDNLANLNMMKQLIKNWTDFEFLSAADPLIGIKEIQKHSPDVILLDINLPKMSGYEVLQHLKENKICDHASIFAVTANAMASDEKKIQHAGFDEYISKPIDIESFLEKLNKVIQ